MIRLALCKQGPPRGKWMPTQLRLMSQLLQTHNDKTSTHTYTHSAVRLWFVYRTLCTTEVAFACYTDQFTEDIKPCDDFEDFQPFWAEKKQTKSEPTSLTACYVTQGRAFKSSLIYCRAAAKDYF